MSNVSTQVISEPEIVQLKAAEIYEDRTPSEYDVVNDHIPVVEVVPNSLVANTTEIYKTQVLAPALEAAQSQTPAPPTAKSKLPLLLGAAVIFFTFRK